MALVVIGGVAAGLSAAARARRIDPRLEIVVLEKGPVVSYGACGLPYLVEGRVHEAEQLIVYTPEYFRKERNIDVRTGARVVAISHPRREVQLETGERIRYDRLVIATGARCDTSRIAGPGSPMSSRCTRSTTPNACAASSARSSPETRGGRRGGVHRSRGRRRASPPRPAGHRLGALEHALTARRPPFTDAVRKQLEAHGVELALAPR